MATEFLTAVGSERVALFHRGESAADHLVSFLGGKGYRVFATQDAQKLRDLVRSGAVDIALVQLTDAATAVSLMNALLEGDCPPPVVALCDNSARATLSDSLPPNLQPNAVLVRPVPFARVVGEIEKQLAARVGHRVSGEQPAVSFAQLLAHLWASKRTGRLQLTVNGVQTTIYLRQGIPLFAEQGSLEDTLGRMLVRTGRITNEDFSRAVTLITDRMVDNEQMRLGEALIELGILTAKEIHEALRDQVRQKILACFRAHRFHSDFRDGEELLEPVGDFSSPIRPLLTEGLKTVNPQRLAQLLDPFDERYPAPIAEASTVAAAFAFNRQEQSFVSAIDGTKTLRQLRQSSQLDPIHATQVLATLLLGRAVELLEDPRKRVETERTEDIQRVPDTTGQPEPSRAAVPTRRHGSAKVAESANQQRNDESALMSLYLRIKGRPDHAVLGVQPNASAGQIEEAFRRRTEELAAVQPGQTQPSPSARTTIDAIGQHLRAARSRLLSPEATDGPDNSTTPAGKDSDAAGSQPDERRRRLLAEQAYQQALVSYQEGKLKDALNAANEALDLHPEAADYQLLQAWLTYRRAKGDEKKKGSERAFDCAVRSFTQDGTSVIGNLVLGHILAQQGKSERARRHLLLALRHDTHKLSEIQDELRQLDKKRLGRRVKGQ